MHNKSFTLIELLTAAAAFCLIAAAAAGLFISGIAAQRKSLASQQVLDQASYGFEYMSRALRMARKEENCSDPLDPSTCQCLNQNGYGWNYEITKQGKGIKFVNYQEVCQEFFLQGSRLKQGKCEDSCSIPGEWEVLPLTGEGLQIEEFAVNLLGAEQVQPDGSWDNQQPRVTLSLKIKGIGERAEARPEIKIQTTVSQRQLDIER